MINFIIFFLYILIIQFINLFSEIPAVGKNVDPEDNIPYTQKKFLDYVGRQVAGRSIPYSSFLSKLHRLPADLLTEMGFTEQEARELAESRLAQIHSFGESQYEEIDLKEEIAKDEFTTIEEARERAEELGCSGTHTHDDAGRLIYMPCATHEEYERRLAEEDGDS